MKILKPSFTDGQYNFYRVKPMGTDIIQVTISEDDGEIVLSSIRPEEMSRKKLDFNNDEHVKQFRKTYR